MLVRYVNLEISSTEQLEGYLEKRTNAAVSTACWYGGRKMDTPSLIRGPERPIQMANVSRRQHGQKDKLYLNIPLGPRHNYDEDHVNIWKQSTALWRFIACV